MPTQPEDIFDVGVDILSTDIADNGTITCQTGDVVSRQVFCANNEWWQPAGFASRPAKPEPGKAACQGVMLNRGDHDVCIGQKDIRGQAIYGNLKDGEFCAYAPGAQGRVSGKADGSVTIYTTDDNTADGNGVYFKVAKDKFQFMAPWGRLTFDATGFHVLTASGARLFMGALSAPAPLDSVLPNQIRMTAQMVSIDSPLTLVGPSDSPLWGAVINTVGPLPPIPAGTILCASPGSPTAPPLNACIGLFVPGA